ncbi:MAG TPA: phospholipase D family protein [Myxococcota bacterium]|jgi:phosphatidylserine/phosphatidylglycerophosphate/cardiolipin synthase-like enzyme|nr:phospholipase D family protein [Myxococcota bacterium]
MAVTPPPPTVRSGSSLDLSVDVTNPRPGDAVTFKVLAAGGTDLVATITAPVIGNNAKKAWPVDAGSRPLPLAVHIVADLRGQTIDVGPTSIVAGTRFSTLGWLTSAGAPVAVDGQDGMATASGGDKLVLKFDLDDGGGGPLKETLAFTFILQRESTPGTFAEVGRFQDSATAVTKFERTWDTPTDSSVPGTFRIVVEVRRAGETGSPPSVGTRTSPPVKLVVLAPLVTSLVVDEASRLGTKVAERVGLGPGQSPQLFWTVLGRFDDVRLDPGNVDVVFDMAVSPGRPENSGVRVVDLDKTPPDPSGVYTLTARLQGLPSPPRTVTVVAVRAFEVRVKDPQPPSAKPKVLTKPDGKSVVPVVAGTTGRLVGAATPTQAPLPQPALPAPGFLGQVSLESTLVFSWTVVGVATGARVELHLHGLNPAVVDVTKATRDGGGTASHEVKDANPPTDTKTFLDAELKIFAADPDGTKRDELSSALIRLRENRPLPKIADGPDGFFALDAGTRILEGGKVKDWSTVTFKWKLEPDFFFNKLLLRVTDEDGLDSGDIILKDVKDGTPIAEKAVPFPAGLKTFGVMTCEARLVNLQGVPGKTRTLHFELGTRPPKDPPAPGFAKWFFRIGGMSEPTEGNEVTVFTEGQEFFDAAVADIATATGPDHFVYLLAWDLQDSFDLAAPGTTTQFLFKTAAAAGAQVRAMLYFHIRKAVFFGGSFTGFDNQPQWEFINTKIGSNGAAIHDDRHLNTGSHHQKILVVNGSNGLSAYCGGMDLNPNRRSIIDVHCRITGPAALDLHRTVVDRWNDHPFGAPRKITTSPNPGKPGKLHVQIARTYGNGGKNFGIDQSSFGQPIGYSFAPNGDFSIKTLIRHAIRTAQEFIFIEDQYLIDMSMAKALAARLPSLKHVVISIPHTDSVNGELRQGWRRRKEFVDTLTAVDPAKVAVCFHKTKFVHSKVWVFDDQFAIIGSANCNRRGYSHDSEVVAGVADPNDAGTVYFAHALRMKMWAKHLGMAEADLWDPIATAKHWKTPPASAQVTPYDPNASKDTAGFPENTDTAWDSIIDPDGS